MPVVAGLPTRAPRPLPRRLADGLAWAFIMALSAVLLTAFAVVGLAALASERAMRGRHG
jgi:hypothetical protein